jgi:L-2,4-diaminobutyric acid acetyltransferase
MNTPVERQSEIQIRTPTTVDVPAIVRVVRSCEPFLTAHSSYIAWIYTQFYFETCAVAELDGEIVAWCSIIPVPGGYFLHQLGVLPKARRHGTAKALLVHQLQKLNCCKEGFELQFTVDRHNGAVLALNRNVAQRFGMQVMKKTGVLQLVEPCEEELYAMTPCRFPEARHFSESSPKNQRGKAFTQADGSANSEVHSYGQKQT